MPDPELVAAMSKLLAGLPGVTEQRTSVHVSFFNRRKVFAFTRSTGDGVALKLPKERIASLLEREDVRLLTMGKRTMKEWIVLSHPQPSGYRKDLPLFKDAMVFVAATSKNRKKTARKRVK